MGLAGFPAIAITPHPFRVIISYMAVPSLPNQGIKVGACLLSWVPLFLKIPASCQTDGMYLLRLFLLTLYLIIVV